MLLLLPSVQEAPRRLQNLSILILPRADLGHHPIHNHLHAPPRVPSNPFPSLLLDPPQWLLHVELG